MSVTVTPSTPGSVDFLLAVVIGVGINGTAQVRLPAVGGGSGVHSDAAAKVKCSHWPADAEPELRVRS